MWQSQLSEEFFGKGTHGLYHTTTSCYHIKPMLSNFSIILDNKVFEISPESYLLDCEDLPEYVCASKSYCLFGVDSMDTEMGAWTQKIFILGETFVKNYYTVFDDSEGYPRLHMAVNRHFKQQALIHNLQSSGGTYFLFMFLTIIATGAVIRTKFINETIKMEKQVRNKMILYEASNAALRYEEEKEGSEEVEGTPAYKKKARLKQGNFGGIQKSSSAIMDTASTLQGEANGPKGTAINDDSVEQLDK